MASVTLPTGGSVPKGLESHTKERKEIRIIDIARKENSMTDVEIPESIKIITKEIIITKEEREKLAKIINNDRSTKK